ncbi:MerR family transcriptional regulator [Paenibacillus oenotherae]|uniref:MerR family transcriptional regulator n=1 Tax=Paenibacillus oenotherae TaxID=1435645 RepID=A0ABS7D1X7_9BACL|nr:MerR family transcriptional regulator [Paenibacillus oenotherae]MBW7473895.1 MerR family transcriptional regulator [Paenibacillus oenotherae]
MLHTVKEVSSISNVTIKTLHHYHRIGLLLPCEISESGYRLYGTKELERLQQILFYRELDFPLETIKELLEGQPERKSILLQQEKLLLNRQQRLETILQTLRTSIHYSERGVAMENQDMFKGLESEAAWKEAMSGQNEYLKQTYEVDLLDEASIDVGAMNEQAVEAGAFMKDMANALSTGIKHNDAQIKELISSHISFLNGYGHGISAADFAAQTRFFLQDDFHLRMLEDQQTGLAYYVAAAADAFVSDN